MSVKVVYIEEFNVVESIFKDRTTLNEVKSSTIEALSIAADHKCGRFLVDCSQLTRGNSVFDLYSIGEYYSSIEILRSMRQAVLIPEEHNLANDLHFYETATRNRGYDVRVFTDRNQAIAWLTEPYL